MSSKFQNKYRIESTRLQNWDYSSDGAYYITICTQNRTCFFGDIKENIMYLNEIGMMAERFWLEIPNHFSFIELGNFIIMPNHRHGILISNNPTVYIPNQNIVSTIDKNKRMSLIAPKPGSIAAIIRSYKSVVTRKAKTIQPNFGWQARFYDHIIRNDVSFHNIQNYILDNPKNWNKDEFY